VGSSHLTTLCPAQLEVQQGEDGSEPSKEVQRQILADILVWAEITQDHYDDSTARCARTHAATPPPRAALGAAAPPVAVQQGGAAQALGCARCSPRRPAGKGGASVAQAHAPPPATHSRAPAAPRPCPLSFVTRPHEEDDGFWRIGSALREAKRARGL
jgi:hypothetical protein